MKKCLKYGLLFALIHLDILIINDNVFTMLSGKYEALPMLFWMVALVFEFPVFLAPHIFNFSFQLYSKQYFIFYYLVGSIFYFAIGLLVGYIREYAR